MDNDPFHSPHKLSQKFLSLAIPNPPALIIYLIWLQSLLELAIKKPRRSSNPSRLSFGKRSRNCCHSSSVARNFLWRSPISGSVCLGLGPDPGLTPPQLRLVVFIFLPGEEVMDVPEIFQYISQVSNIPPVVATRFPAALPIMI